MKKLFLLVFICLLGFWFVQEYRRSLKLSFSSQELKVIAKPLRPLLDYIAKGEGGYNSVNRGVAGDTHQSWPKNHLGKNITEMSIIEIRKHQGGQNPDCWFRKKKGEANLFAVGRYQLIPCTLKESLQRIPNLSGKELYSPAIQDMFGAQLVLVKRQRLGRFLLGYHDDIQLAGQELAKEFASIPIQFSNGRCQRGQSFYCGDSAGNASHSTVEEAVETLKITKGVLGRSSEVRQILSEKWWL